MSSPASAMASRSLMVVLVLTTWAQTVNLECSPSVQTAALQLMTWGSIPDSQLKVDSAFYPSKVGKMSTQLAGGGQCVACIINL